MVARGSKQINDSRRFGRELAQAFIDGADPTPVQVPVRLGPGEFCVGQVQVTVYQWREGEGDYVHKSGGYAGGGILGYAALRGAKAIGNSRRRSKAAREAAATWREVDRGTLFVTNKRFAVQGSVWTDVWFPSIRSSETDSRAITLQVAGIEPMMFEVDYADYWYVMFQKLAYGEHHMPDPPTDEVAPDAGHVEPV